MLQNSDPFAIGSSGSGLGYEGIPDSLAIEFDLLANRDMGDPNGMHVAVHVTGCRLPNSPKQTSRIAFFTDVLDLRGDIRDGLHHTARIVYTPVRFRVAHARGCDACRVLSSIPTSRSTGRRRRTWGSSSSRMGLGQ